MTRPTGWEIVGEPSDPVPGDPVQVAELGRKLRQTADRITRQADELRAMASVESWKGKAADEFRETAEDTAGRLRKAFHRYDAAAKALGTTVQEGYAAKLDHAQRAADKALEDAKAHHGEYLAMTRAIDHLPEGSSDDPTYKRLASKKDSANEALSRSRNQIRTAKELHHQAAEDAARDIRHAITHDGLKDSRWSTFKHWVHKNSGWIEKVATIAGWVATVCGVLSMCVGWIPVVGTALSKILGTIALIATVVALIAHLTLALSGDGSWFDVGMDVVALVTFGIGRGAAGGVRSASASARASAWTRAFEQRMTRAGAGTMRRGSAAYTRAERVATRQANRLVPAGAEAAETAARAPKGFFPGWRNLGQGFNPAEIVKDGWGSVKGLKDLGQAGQLFKGETWRGARVLVGDIDIMDDLAKLERVDPALLRHVGQQAVHRQTLVWVGNTAVATGLDFADKIGLTEGFKNPLTREVGRQ